MRTGRLLGEVTASAADVAKMHLVCRIDRVPANSSERLNKLKELPELDLRRTATSNVSRLEQRQEPETSR